MPRDERSDEQHSAPCREDRHGRHRRPRKPPELRQQIRSQFRPPDDGGRGDHEGDGTCVQYGTHRHGGGPCHGSVESREQDRSRRTSPPAGRRHEKGPRVSDGGTVGDPAPSRPQSDRGEDEPAPRQQRPDPAPTANGVPWATSQMSEPTRIAVSEADSPAAKIQTSRVSTTVMTSLVNAAHSPAATPATGAGSGPERQNEVTALVGEAQPARVALIRSWPPGPRHCG